MCCIVICVAKRERERRGRENKYRAGCSTTKKLANRDFVVISKNATWNEPTVHRKVDFSKAHL